MGRDGVRLIRFLAGVKVQRIGGHVIRSEPGEPPRRDSGTLWSSVKYKIERKTASSADLVFYSTDNPAKVATLEYGDTSGDRAPRPLWAPARKMMGNLRQEFKRRLTQKMNQMRSDQFNSLPSAYDEE